MFSHSVFRFTSKAFREWVVSMQDFSTCHSIWMKLVRRKPLQETLLYSSSSNFLCLEHQCTNSSHIQGEEWGYRGAFNLLFGWQKQHRKVQWCHLHLSPPMTALQNTFNLFAPHYFRSTELVESKAFGVPARGCGCCEVRGSTEKEGGHESFEGRGTRRCRRVWRMGRAAETGRLADSWARETP